MEQDKPHQQLPAPHNAMAETVEFPPAPARVFAVAAGLTAWSSAEQAWLDANPKWREYEQRFRDTLIGIEQDRGGSSFTKRMEEERRRSGERSIEE